jgi:hypothetical protein
LNITNRNWKPANREAYFANRPDEPTNRMVKSANRDGNSENRAIPQSGCADFNRKKDREPKPLCLSAKHFRKSRIK